MKNMMRILAVRLLLGWKREEFCDVVRFNNKPYMISIHLYEPADKFVDRMEKALQKQDHNLKKGDKRMPQSLKKMEKNIKKERKKKKTAPGVEQSVPVKIQPGMLVILNF